MNSTSLQILSNAKDLFLKYGFKAVTVDEIAKQTGISKKTLYENFKDKDEIVDGVLDIINQKMLTDEIEIFKASDNAIDETISHIAMMEQTLSSMNANCIPDLQKYYPMAFNRFKENKSKQTECIEKNIKRGIKEGYFRKNLNVQFCAWYRLDIIMYLVQHSKLPVTINKVEAQVEMMQHFLYGISTIKGHQLIEEYITKYKKKK